MPNRLALETSPYLLQHKDNPVDWLPWGEEAFKIAVDENKPVFLSVGYSSCHWCHVMAHESFEDDEIAEVLNKYFVCIKLDREERPDVDETYMTATQLATGHGGWPLSIFMTPDKKPFYTGTYFPKEHRGDYPGFRSVVTSLGQAWESQQSEIEQRADEFVAGLSQAITQDAGPLTDTLEPELIDLAIEQSHSDFDFEHGGFGERPKFPPHSAINFLIEYAAKRHELPGEELRINALCEQAGHMGLMTLEEMALGGIHDQVGGGFHRYSTDAEWRLPHFEKMLSDNALLLGLYTRAASSTGDDRLKSLFTRTASKIVAWIEEELLSPEGLFMTAMDADTEGEEGLYYTWTSEEVNEALGERAETFREVFDFSDEGNFLDEATGQATKRNVLVLDQDVEGAFDQDFKTLKELRASRTKPMTDDKALCSWNGLAIGSLAQCGRTDLAAKSAKRWVEEFEKNSYLPHQITQGKAAGFGFLDDYAFMANGLIDLSEATSDESWKNSASKICDLMCELFREESGLFRSSSAKHEQLFGRMTPVLDQAIPSAVADAARLLARLGRNDEARQTVLACLGWLQRMTSSTQSLLLLALEDFIAFPDANRTVQGVETSEVSVSLEPAEIQIDEKGLGHSEIVFQIPDGSHINSTEPAAKWLTPTTVRVDGVYGEAGFPPADNEQYTGEVRIGLRLKPKTGTQKFAIHVRYQACTETDCQLPQEKTLTGIVIVP